MNGAVAKLERRSLRRAIGDAGLRQIDNHSVALNELAVKAGLHEQQIEQLQRVTLSHADTANGTFRELNLRLDTVAAIVNGNWWTRLKWVLLGHV